MNPVEQKWQDARTVLISETAACSQVICLIPGWEWVDLATGLQWLQASIYEGYSVRHRTDITDRVATVRFQKWDYGENEPEFPTV